MIFLFSPDISLFDLLPDVIGWFLIVLGLGRLADIEMRADDAKAMAKRMMLFSAVKLALSLFTFRFNSSDLLLAAFSYAIVEIITVLPFTRDLFKALDYTAMRVDAPLDSDKLNVAKWYLYVFFIIKNAFSVLPAMVSLFDSRFTGKYSANTWFIDFDAAVRTLMMLSFFLAVILSVVMLSFFIPFWTRIIKNKELNGKMSEHRRVTVLEVPVCMLRKNTSFVLSFFTPAMVFFYDFYIDGIDVLPTFVGFIAVFVAAFYAKKYMGIKTLPLMAVSLVGTVVSLAAFLYRLIPLTKNSFVIDYNFTHETFTLPLAIADSLLIVVTVILMYRYAGAFNREYTKYKLEDSLAIYMIGGAVVAVFDALLYAFPGKNTTFVFPSLIFGISFSALGAYYFIKLLKQIKHDNKF